MALTNEQLVVLNDELINDPLGRGYDTLDNEQARDDLNNVYRAYSFDLLIFDFEQRIRDAKKWDDFLYRAQAKIPDPEYNDDQLPNYPQAPWAEAFRFPAINEFMSSFDGRIQNVDTRAHPNRQDKEGVSTYWPDLLDRCEAEGSMGATLVVAVKALCDTTVSRSWELVDVEVTTQDVIDARAL